MHELNKHIAYVVKQLRQKQGLSQESLAERCGLDRTYISGIERCSRNITIASLEKLVSALNISTADFLREVIDSYEL